MQKWSAQLSGLPGSARAQCEIFLGACDGRTSMCLFKGAPHFKLVHIRCITPVRSSDRLTPSKNTMRSIGLLFSVALLLGCFSAVMAEPGGTTAAVVVAAQQQAVAATGSVGQCPQIVVQAGTASGVSANMAVCTVFVLFCSAVKYFH